MQFTAHHHDTDKLGLACLLEAFANDYWTAHCTKCTADEIRPLAPKFPGADHHAREMLLGQVTEVLAGVTCGWCNGPADKYRPRSCVASGVVGVLGCVVRTCREALPPPYNIRDVP